ncbi:MAG: YsnF/AvaK domain-containing protein [Acidobacteriaceae bacterium]|nr:YsnF/AvaK domain-containing protein [Acidobacteriaceae bacterium]MBV9295246.1 YsnF/AvaK domain-containing protein [Acidobacteriaceae bacterium]MBV9767444.1 YsnF/AvaK domain-containing protein [Acidobacteriaceae bacterium]
MDRNEDDVVIPVISEELHADAVPVQTGSVRVTKRVQAHDEILEQALRKGRVEVKRVKTDRVVDGPQEIQRAGDTLIVPVVSEVLRVEKQWVVTEEIHITQIEERETIQQTVTVNREEAEIERLDDQGNVISTIDTAPETETPITRAAPASVVARRDANQPASRRVRSILRKKTE